MCALSGEYGFHHSRAEEEVKMEGENRRKKEARNVEMRKQMLERLYNK